MIVLFSYVKIISVMINIFKELKISKRVMVYGFVGVSAFTTEYVSFIVLLSLMSSSIGLAFSQVLSFCMALVVSFFGNRLFTFKKKDTQYTTKTTHQVGMFLVLSASNFLISSVGIYVLSFVLGVIPIISKLIMMISIVVWNFAIFNKIIFKSK